MKYARPGSVFLALCLASLGGSFLGGSVGQAQEASPPRPSHIHSGDCDELGEVIQPTQLVDRAGRRRLGQQRRGRRRGGVHQHPAVPRRAAGGGPCAQGPPLGGPDPGPIWLWGHRRRGGRGRRADRRHERAGRLGYAGIAYLVPAANGSTSISVMIARVVADETSGAVAEEAAAGQGHSPPRRA